VRWRCSQTGQGDDKMALMTVMMGDVILKISKAGEAKIATLKFGKFPDFPRSDRR
jgi:hypothetical protein